MAPPLIAFVGPTAAGKTALAHRLALERGGEIVSCDSLEVYRGLDIGSAKATAEERGQLPYHLLDVVDPDEQFSAAEYERLARMALEGIRLRGRLPIVAGGTGLYLRALIAGLFDGPSRDEAFRRRLEGMARRGGDARLHRLLARMDPESAARIHLKDRVRVVRALEVFRATGRPLSEHHRGGGDPLRGFSLGLFGLAPDRQTLLRSVEKRTEEMWARGLLDEVSGLLARGFSRELRPLRAIGYRHAVAVLQGQASREEARRDMVKATMGYAKRQMTWFRHQAAVTWCASPQEAYLRASTWLDERGRGPAVR